MAALARICIYKKIEVLCI